MSNERTIPNVADSLMRGPRGRRFLLEYALASERLTAPEYREDSCSAAVFLASYHLDPGKGTTAQLFGDVPAGIPIMDAADTMIAADTIVAADVAERLASIPLAEATPTLLRDCLCVATDMARYWQQPDGRDVLASTGELRAPLQRVAEHVAASPHTAWWGEPVTERSQWAVEWEGEPPVTDRGDPAVVLREARDRDIEEELVARRERPDDPTANWSGNWWSRPPWELPSSAGELFDGSPAKLWFVEDSLGWERAETRRLGVPEGLRVYEIDSADAWASLCVRFPLEVTAQKRHDWYCTTGRDGSWVIPDWAKVALHFDGAHLQVQAYLAAAGTAIPVDDCTASVIAGWDPDQTFWFSPNVRFIEATVTYRFQAYQNHVEWLRAETNSGDGR